MRSIRPVVLAAFAALLVVGCRRSPNDVRLKEESTESVQSQNVPPFQARADFSGRGVAGGVQPASALPRGYAVMSAPTPTATSPVPPETSPAEPLPPSAVASSAQDTAPATGAMLVRSGEASVEVDSFETAVARVRAIAARVGGYVANTSLATGRDQVRSGTLELKVPSARFDEVVSGLAPLGKVEVVHVYAQDVGEEYVDVAAREANARRLETRLVSLLEQRAGKLSDALAVERELARVREEIERSEGRLRYLRTHVAMSTLAVTVHERPPVVGRTPNASPIGDAARQAWRNFVGLVAWSVAASGVLVPLGLLAWLLLLWWRRGPGDRPMVRLGRRAPQVPNVPNA